VQLRVYVIADAIDMHLQLYFCLRKDNLVFIYCQLLRYVVQHILINAKSLQLHIHAKPLGLIALRVVMFI